jgi:hypothetical protein
MPPKCFRAAASFILLLAASLTAQSESAMAEIPGKCVMYCAQSSPGLFRDPSYENTIITNPQRSPPPVDPAIAETKAAYNSARGVLQELEILELDVGPVKKINLDQITIGELQEINTHLQFVMESSHEPTLTRWSQYVRYRINSWIAWKKNDYPSAIEQANDAIIYSFGVENSSAVDADIQSIKNACSKKSGTDFFNSASKCTEDIQSCLNRANITVSVGAAVCILGCASSAVIEGRRLAAACASNCTGGAFVTGTVSDILCRPSSNSCLTPLLTQLSRERAACGLAITGAQ